MKKIIVSIVLGLASITAAQAQTALNSSSALDSRNESAATSINGGTGNGNTSLSLTSNGYAPDKQTIRSAPTVYTPSPFGSFSPSSCMVSGSAGVSVVGFGVSGATPIQDENCNTRQNFLLLKQVALNQTVPMKRSAYENAANDILCSQGGSVYEAMAKQGLCTIERDSSGRSITADARVNRNAQIANQRQLDEMYSAG